MQHLYYQFKPFVPRRVRDGIRRWWMKRRREQFCDVWPINEAAAHKPEGWTGWPEGKQFALVLTHDVESQKGLDNVRPLMELEMSLGFRSCFYFVPEGDYTVPDELIRDLKENGFEVGVHGLKHDGKLYRSRNIFRERAKRINHYLKKWGAVGFRSPYMHHKLDWLHDLNIQYDASTFDTDPFEPQPDGVNTLFPFRVDKRGGAENSDSYIPTPESSSNGYVELPYTLPQDSTLFLFLREPTIDIWKTKLDWVAAHGGMAMLTVHPDYLSFDGTNTGQTYPSGHYAEFLKFVRAGYENQFVSLSPSEVASHARKTPITRHRRQRSVCMVAYSFYESDNRIRRYAESLVDRGDKVDVISLRRPEESSSRASLNGVRIHRIQARSKDERSSWSYFRRLLQFTVLSSLHLARRHLSEPYDVVHVHNIPDFLVFAAWLPKLLGAKVILDVHDMVPEFYADKFQSSERAMTVRALYGIERASAWFADHVIISNDLWCRRFVARSAPESKCSVFLNHVDTKLFHPRTRTRKDDRFVVIFPGGLQKHQGLDVAIRAMDILSRELPNTELHIYGDGSAREELLELKRELGLNGNVQFHAPVPIDDVPGLIANADLGIVPKRADSFGNEAYSTKIMEFMSQGVPVVVSDTAIDKFYYDDRIVRFFKSGNHREMADAIFEVLSNEELRQGLVERARVFTEANNWDSRRGNYLQLVDSLCVTPNGEASQ